MNDTPPDYEAIQKAAKENYAKFAREFPRRLAKLEDGAAKRARDSRKSLFVRLEELYKSMDEVFAFVKAYTPCRQGCCSCCYYEIEVGNIGVVHMERNLGIRCDCPPIPIVKPHGLPCPFLRDGSCTIYPHRPYHCRKHVALVPTPYWCHPDRSNRQGFMMLNFATFDEAMANLCFEFGKFEARDIRNVFPWGLGTADARGSITKSSQAS